MTGEGTRETGTKESSPKNFMLKRDRVKTIVSGIGSRNMEGDPRGVRRSGIGFQKELVNMENSDSTAKFPCSCSTTCSAPSQLLLLRNEGANG